MLNQTTTKSLFIGLISAVGLIGLSACEAPQEAEAPAVEAESTLSESQTDQERPGAAGMEATAPGEQRGAPQPGAQPSADQPPQMGEAPRELERPPQGDPMQQQQPPAAPPAAMEGEVSDEDLQQFAQAVELTAELQQKHNLQAQMMQAESQEEQLQIQEQFVNELQGQIEDATEMSFPEYVAMAQRIEQDPALQQRFSAYMQP